MPPPSPYLSIELLIPSSADGGGKSGEGKEHEDRKEQEVAAGGERLRGGEEPAREVGDKHRGGGVRGIWGTITDRGHCSGGSTSHVLASGTPESLSTPRLQPLQAGGQSGLFVFKQHLLLSNNKKNQNNRGQVQLGGGGDLPQGPWVPPVTRADGTMGTVFRVCTFCMQHTQTWTFVLLDFSSPFLAGDIV